jgi:hypothetical protein
VTGPKFTDINCSVCGRVMGKKPGVQVILGVVCDNPICHYQGPAAPNAARDALLVAGIHEGIPVSQVALGTGMTRQRIYQILDTWKAGV